MAKKKHREKALIISANIIVKKGLELQNKLNQNDSAISKTDKLGQEQTIGNDADKAGKSDIPKISGGTLSEVITKITEMLSGKSGSDLKNGANNFSAMIEVLSAPEVSKKFSQTMICLAQDPVLVVVIKDLLKDTKASNIFASAIDQNFSASEKAAVSAVLPSDVELRKQENIISNIADKKLVNYQHQI